MTDVYNVLSCVQRVYLAMTRFGRTAPYPTCLLFTKTRPACLFVFVYCPLGQVCTNGIQSTPLNLAVYWKCESSTTDLRVDYRYNPEAMHPPGPLSTVQVLVPVSGGVANIQAIPSAIW